MTGPQFILSAFGDEIADDLATQLDLLAEEGVRHLELRSAWGKNVLDLSEDELLSARALLDQRGFGVSAVGSPIGKSQIDQPHAFEIERLERAIGAAQVLGTDRIRVFSYYCGENPADHRDGVLARMRDLAERAAAAHMLLIHENEKDIYGDTADRCHDLFRSVDMPALRAAFDPANFVQCGVRPMDEAWPLLADFVGHIHIKDAVFADGGVRPAGQGDGAIPALLATLAERGYQGFLTLEPHLKVAGRSGGFSGEEGMRVAIRALRGLLEPFPQIEVR
jgi:sugar phosphate isomerase/epimerase